MRRATSGFLGGGVAGAIMISAIAFAQSPKADTPTRPDGAGQGQSAEKKAEKTRDAVPPKAGPAEEEQKLKAEVRQRVIAYRPVLMAELRRVRMACEPTADQRRQIAREAGRLLEDAVTAVVRKERVGGKEVRTASAFDHDPWKPTRAGLAVFLKSHLSPEQWARYQEESRKRSANRKRTGLRNLLAQLDRSLCLTGSQRDKIGQSLDIHWNDTWNCAETLVNDGVFPRIPDPIIVPFLSDVQSTIWKGLQKHETSAFDWVAVSSFYMEGLPAEDEIEPGKAGEAGSHR
jgi:hypothetical protein